MSKKLISVSVVSALLSCVGISLVFAQEMHFDHGLYREVLTSYLSNGEVDYPALKQNPVQLNSYLAKVASLKPEELKSMPRDEKLAFYINVYNAFTLKAIIDHYPVKSIKKIPGVWKKLKFNVAGEELTLWEIEHKVLRKEFKDPRIHFVLVCASRGCPELRGKPFRGEDIDKVLDEVTYNFINDKSKNRLDKERRVFHLSSIFGWYKEDFGNVLGYVIDYLPPDEALFVRGQRIRIKWNRYDWSLNEKTR